MTAIVTIDGVRALALISCHKSGLFSYHDGKQWIRNARTVPRAVLDDPQLPEEERLRVMSRMAMEGVVPS